MCFYNDRNDHDGRLVILVLLDTAFTHIIFGITHVHNTHTTGFSRLKVRLTNYHTIESNCINFLHANIGNMLKLSCES